MKKNFLLYNNLVQQKRTLSVTLHPKHPWSFWRKEYKLPSYLVQLDIEYLDSNPLSQSKSYYGHIRSLQTGEILWHGFVVRSLKTNLFNACAEIADHYVVLPLNDEHLTLPIASLVS